MPYPNLEGRAYKEIDQKQFESMIECGCTILEVSHILNLDDKTISDWCERTYGGAGFSEVFSRFFDAGSQSLRHKMYQDALAGNSKLLIHISKTRLGNVERQEVSGPNREPINIIYRDAVPGE